MKHSLLFLLLLPCAALRAQSPAEAYAQHYAAAQTLAHSERVDTSALIAHITQAVALREQTLGVHSTEYADLLITASKIFHAKGETRDAIGLCQQALVKCERQLADTTASVGLYLQGMAYACLTTYFTSLSEREASYGSLATHTADLARHSLQQALAVARAKGEDTTDIDALLATLNPTQP